MIDCKKSPCKTCPYRKDVRKSHWSIEEFKLLIDNDRTDLGSVYGCHLNNGKMCTGFVMDQDRRRMPSIMLRIKLSRDGTTVKDLDGLSCKSELYESIEVMAKANFPELDGY